FGHVVGMLDLETPSIETNRDVIGERVRAGEIIVDQARELVAQKEHVVGKEIGMNDALRQISRPRFFEKGEFLLEKILQVALDFVGAFAAAFVEWPPARDRERIRALARIIE